MLREVCEPSRIGLEKLSREFKRLFKWHPVVPQAEVKDIVAGYTGRLRLRYEEAARSLREDGPCTVKDARISAFVKAEKYDALAKARKPRMIWARRPRYNLELASFLKPIEQSVYGLLKTPKRAGVPPTRVVAKGLNGPARANLIKRKMSHFVDCRVFEVDMTAFEAHHDLRVLRMEHALYRRFNPDPRLAQLLCWQEVNKGVTQNGIKFRREGGRASGDFNTGMGNSLAMVAMCVAAIEEIRPSGRWDLLADGDNCLFFVEGKDLHLFTESLTRVFRAFGHEAKVEKPVRVMEQVTFGQSRPVRTVLGWTMVRDPLKVLSGAFTGHRHYGELRGGTRILKSVAQCELVLNRGVPILSVYAGLMLKELSQVRFAKKFEPDELRYSVAMKDMAWQTVRDVEISPEARASFALAWNFTPDEQLAIEARLRCVGIEVPDRWDAVASWCDGPEDLLIRGPSVADCEV